MSSPAPATGMLRLARAGVLTLATVGLSLTAHVAAGGGAPDLVGLLLVATPVLTLSLLATARRLGLVAAGTHLAVTQVGLHVGFMALSGGGQMPPVAAGRHGHLLLGVTGPGDGLRPPGVGPSLLDLALPGTSPVMTGAHVVAGALVALLLARGESALWSLWSWLRPALPAAVRLVVPAGGPATTPAATRWSIALATRPRPRGPPRHVVPPAPATDWPLAAPA